MKFVTNCGLQIMQQIFKLKQHLKKHRLIYSAVVIFVLLLLDSYTCNFIINKGEITLVNVVSFIIAVIGLRLFFMRVDIQTKQRVDERFTTAVNLLGSSETSARTGAIYSLFHLASDEKKYRKEIAQILCSHIRSKTDIRSKTKEENYQERYKDRPSNEIQTTINLLFKTNGLYDKFNKELEPADLRHAFLAGADFRDAECQGADFRYAECQRAWFLSAECQGAYFSDAKCQGAYFLGAKYQGAEFWRAQCQGAWFLSAECQGAYFSDAKCQGANFYKAQCQGADFKNAGCQGANFENAECQGANFYKAQYQGADFSNTQCQGAYSENSITALEKRIGKNTKLDNVIFAGALDDKTIQSIESAKAYLDDDWYKRMQEIIKENESKGISHKLPKRIITSPLEDSEEIQPIITGVLKNSEEIQAIIAKDWKKLKKIQAEKRKK